MRRSFALVLLFVIGCAAPSPDSDPSKADTDAAQAYIRKTYPNAEILLVEGPEYADIQKIPKRTQGDRPSDKTAACGVYVKFHYTDNHGNVTDGWVVLVSSDHQVVRWFGVKRENWREFVQSLARK